MSLMMSLQVTAIVASLLLAPGTVRRRGMQRRSED